jgi:thioesterase domain-containing protein
MEKIIKPKIESIYPLSFMQHGLLFHSVSSAVDQGFLLVQANLKGSIDPMVFEKAWNRVIQRHQVMRTTVHWENLEKSLQIVHENKRVRSKNIDWKTKIVQERKEDWEKLKTIYLNKGASFKEGALLDIVLVENEVGHYKLLWPVHHLLLDGWSSSIILNDFLIAYEAIVNGKVPSFEPIPSHKAYLKWLSNKDSKYAKEYWSSCFKDFQTPFLFRQRRNNMEGSKTQSITSELSRSETLGLQSFARKTKVTLNTVLQGIWSLVLFRYFDTKDIVHGTTVSGRSSDFPNMHLLAGMYMNVQLVRNKVKDEEKPFSEWFKDIQEKQQQASKFEYLGMDEIISFLDVPLKNELFDSLFIFENYPIIDSRASSIEVTDFESGLTSTYPVTMVVIPGETIQFNMLVDSEVVEEKSATWLFNSFNNIIKYIISEKVNSYSELVHLVTVSNIGPPRLEEPASDQSDTYSSPINGLQAELIEIWEDLFGYGPIGIYDNFFEIGGKSMLALKMFTQIQKRMGHKIAPTVLLGNPTVASLSMVLDGSICDIKYKYSVPIRATGAKAPLFCIHAGGGHVFFYNQLAGLIDPNRPVYAMQPLGIEGGVGMHKSIEEMAVDYAKEIRLIQPKGPYNFMVYCFSAAVGIEMAIILSRQGQQTNLIVADSLPMQEDLHSKTRIKMRIVGFMKRLIKNPLNGLEMVITDKYNRYLKPQWINFFGSHKEKVLEKLQANLIKIYNNYKWREYPGKTSLILTKKTDKMIYQEYINVWNRLSIDGIDVIPCEGNHRTLFEKPDIEFVAKKIDQCMLEKKRSKKIVNAINPPQTF